MNSIPIPVRFSSGQTRHLSRAVAATGVIVPLGKPSPEWLPVPAVHPQTKMGPNNSVTQPAFWMTPARTSIFEKALMISLVIAAAAGVAYGFASLLDLVQNWAVFHAGVMQLLQ